MLDAKRHEWLLFGFNKNWIMNTTEIQSALFLPNASAAESSSCYVMISYMSNPVAL